MEAGPGGLADGQVDPEQGFVIEELVLHQPEFLGLVDLHVHREPERLVGKDGGHRDGFHRRGIDVHEVHALVTDDVTGPVETVMPIHLVVRIIVKADEVGQRSAEVFPAK